MPSYLFSRALSQNLVLTLCLCLCAYMFYPVFYIEAMCLHLWSCSQAVHTCCEINIKCNCLSVSLPYQWTIKNKTWWSAVRSSDKGTRNSWSGKAWKTWNTVKQKRKKKTLKLEKWRERRWTWSWLHTTPTHFMDSNITLPTCTCEYKLRSSQIWHTTRLLEKVRITQQLI